MVERALRDLHYRQDVLDGHLIVALGVYQTLSGIQDAVAVEVVLFLFNNACHVTLLNKPTVGLLLRLYSKSEVCQVEII